MLCCPMGQGPRISSVLHRTFQAAVVVVHSAERPKMRTRQQPARVKNNPYLAAENQAQLGRLPPFKVHI